ncbi:GvpL/GvpF family gas vesicle protein [Actinophytocola sp.]|uniref:GvpL/GvpF family gas vesicle protein n=1 Tax=Actinophytocola sp. TaxID=1872138 RepID=UPI002ED5AC2A
MTEGDRSWLYAVTRELDQAVLCRMAGVAGETPHVVECTRLTAVVGRVPASSFGQEALHRNLEDLDWLDRVARAHNAVVDTLARVGPTVPLRLATIYLDDVRVQLAVDEHEPQFQRTLSHVAGRTEWGVKAVLDPALLGGESTTDTAGSPGMAYLRRQREALSARDRALRFGAEQAEHIHSRLSALAVDAQRHRPQDPQLAGEKLPMILNATYLVENDATQEFGQAVARYGHAHPAIQLKLTGPWPPYSFSSQQERTP